MHTDQGFIRRLHRLGVPSEECRNSGKCFHPQITPPSAELPSVAPMTPIMDFTTENTECTQKDSYPQITPMGRVSEK